MDRKDFLITLGIGTTIAISGYFFLDSVNETLRKDESVSSDTPILKSNVHSKEENGMFNLSHGSDSCYVNNTGQQIISYMDGKNNIIDIARKVSGLYPIEFSDLLVASVAYFVSQLADAGFLASPFYATFYESYS